MVPPRTGRPAAGARRRGRWAEEIAARYLALQGWRVMDHNRRGGGGEIDLLARDGDTLVFVEVRLRERGAWVGPAASVRGPKLRRLRSCARALLDRRGDLHWPGRRLRFDVLALELHRDGLQLEHLRHVLRSG